jgi:hypothetical protein
MDSLSRSAFIIYIVHHIYVLWLQRALMGINIHASLKFLIVFSGANAVELDNRSVRAGASAASPRVLGGYFRGAAIAAAIQIWDSIPTHEPGCALDLDVRWTVPSNQLPSEVWVYRLLPHPFSPTVVSNLVTRRR